jgi:hypothetical protein
MRQALEDWSDSLSRWERAFTAIVVLGLAFEYLPQIGHAIEWMFAVTLATVNVHADLLSQLGRFLVIVGVAGELVVSIRASRVETDLREESNAILAHANERAANAERIAAEANLARVKLEQRMRSRSIFGAGYNTLKELLVSRSGTTVDLVLFDHHVLETASFTRQLIATLKSTGWKIRVWKSRKAVYRVPGPSTMVIAALEHEKEYSAFADDLARELTALQVDCSVSLGGFGLKPKAEFELGDFDLDFEEPRQVFGRTRLMHPI